MHRHIDTSIASKSLRVAGPETARAIACILLVLYHTIGISPKNGLEFESGPWRIVADLLVYVRLPMFAFVAGYVYALRPATGFDSEFIIKKARRLLLPMAAVATLFVTVQNLVPGTHAKNELSYNLLVYPIGAYWFIESLFIIFVVTVVLEHFEFLETPIGVATTLVCAIAIQFGAKIPDYFSLHGAIYLFPYFLVGLACRRFRIESGEAFTAAFLAAVAGSTYLVTCVAKDIPLPDRISISSLLVGMSIPFFVLWQPWHPKILMRIGQSAYAIFLFHPFFTASARIGAHTLGFFEKNTLVVVATLSGIFGPILLEMLIRRSSVARFLLLGDPWPSSRQIRESA